MSTVEIVVLAWFVPMYIYVSAWLWRMWREDR